MAITLNTQQKLNTYLLERNQGQLFDTYYRAIEEYINGPIYRILNIALNDLFISSATPHGLDAWEVFYTRKPGEMPYMKWAELLILLNKTTREGPTFNNIRALLRFFDPTADISLVGSLAVLSENSAFTVGTPVPPFNQRTEYVELTEDSEFKLNSNDPPEFIVYDRDSILYETTILNISSDNYRELLETLLREVLPANVRVLMRYNDRPIFYHWNWGLTTADRSKLYRAVDLSSWTFATLDRPIYKLGSFYGTEVGVVAVTYDPFPFRYFKVVGTSSQELVLEDTTLPNRSPAGLYPFGPDHMLIVTGEGPGAWKLTKIRVNNITTSVIQKQVTTPSAIYGDMMSVTVHEQYFTLLWQNGSTRYILTYDKDLNLVASQNYTTAGYVNRFYPVNKDKAFWVSTSPLRVEYVDIYTMPTPTILNSVSQGAFAGVQFNWLGFHVVDGRSFIFVTRDISTSPYTHRVYAWNPQGAGTLTLVHTSTFGGFMGLRRMQVLDTDLYIFCYNGAVIKIADYLTTKTVTQYWVPVAAPQIPDATLVRSSDQTII